MSEDPDGDDAAAPEAQPDVETLEMDVAAVREQVEALETDLEAAATEPDLDEVEAELETAREAHEAVEIPDEPEEPEDEDEEPPEDPYADVREDHEELGDALDDVESGIEDQRGPYAEDVVDEVESAASELESTRWTEEGVDELESVVATAREDAVDALGIEATAVSPADDRSDDAETDGMSDDAAAETDAERVEDDYSAEADEPRGDETPAPGAERDRIDARIDADVAGFVATLEDVVDAVEAAGLDPDDDAETIAALLEVTDELQDGIDDARAWDDLEVREQLRREGFYDVLDHVKDFPPEWHALKVHQREGNVEMVLLALDALDSEFMEGHCFEALERLAHPAAIDDMVQLANRRDENAISVLGTIGVADDEVVDTLLDYVDTGDVGMRTTTFRALGQLGAEAAVQPIADQLAADNPTIRSQAARALGLIGDTRTIDPLSELLAEDDDDNVRASAAWALRQIGTEAALAEVAGYDDDRAYLVQAEAERAQ